METTISKGNEFETLVYEILYHTIPQSIEFYYGSGDRGRDIVLQYNMHGQNKQVIVECKNYHGTVTQKTLLILLIGRWQTGQIYIIFGFLAIYLLQQKII